MNFRIQVYVYLGIVNSNTLTIEIKKESAKTYISRPNPKFATHREIFVEIRLSFVI